MLLTHALAPLAEAAELAGAVSAEGEALTAAFAPAQSLSSFSRAAWSSASVVSSVCSSPEREARAVT